VLPHYNLASLDITNLYSNIPVQETRTILADILKRELIDRQKQQELLKWFDVITKQNYFAHKKQIIIQHDGLAMGAPSSGLIAEIFLQHMEHSQHTEHSQHMEHSQHTEHSQLVHLTQNHSIINYCRYVDDILIIFDSNHTTIEMILNDFNSLHPKLQFTAETENDRTLNYLDISIHRTPTNLKTSI
jgi:hypothetical protein